jgi:hypothetical protein
LTSFLPSFLPSISITKRASPISPALTQFEVLCVVSRRYVLCRVASRRVASCRVVSCRVVSCRVVSCRVVSCRVVSFRVVSCRVVSCWVLLGRAVPCHGRVVPYRVRLHVIFNAQFIYRLSCPHMSLRCVS